MSKKKQQPTAVEKIIGVPRVRIFSIGDIHPASYNPRTITDDALAGLTKSIEQFGCVEPIVVNVFDGRNIIIGGHQRYKSLQASGVKKILCVTVDLCEKEERILNLTLNNPEIQGRFISGIAEYIDQLQEQFGANEQEMLDLKISMLRESVGAKEKDGLVGDDELPKTPEMIITQPGDLWLLGDHRLLCGDSTKPECIEKLMDGKKAVLLATDPPYCVDYTGANRPGGNGKDWSDKYHEVDIKNAVEFITAFLQACIPHVGKKTAVYMWYACRRRHEMEHVAEKMGFLIHQDIVWAKPCAVMTHSVYAWQHEPCLLMWPRGYKPVRYQTKRAVNSVWFVGFDKTGDPADTSSYTDLWLLDWDGKKRQPNDIEHPTVKPVEVFARPMRMHTRPGDICLEPFSGSGSQIIAAEKLGRKCYAMELEPFFVDVAVKRWEAWTGKKARRIAVKAKECRRGRKESV